MGLGIHVRKNHGFSSKEYYDEFYKIETDGNCKICGVTVNFNNLRCGYRKFCSSKCSNTDPEVKIKIGNKSPETKRKMVEKTRQTLMKKYGNPNYRNFEKSKKTKEKRYGDPNYNNKEKNKVTNMERYGVENTFQLVDRVKKGYVESFGYDSPQKCPEIRLKTMLTNIKRYGVPYPMQCKEILDLRTRNNIDKCGKNYAGDVSKMLETKRKKYGVNFELIVIKMFLTKHLRYNDHYYNNRSKALETMEELYGDHFSKTDKFRQIMEDNNIWVPLELKNEIEKYRRLVNTETSRWKKQLFEEWDGLCYYTNEKLVITEDFKENNPDLHPNRNKLRPTIDHKNSVYWGFLNKIEPNIIGNINNLCICGASTNSVKNYKCAEEFWNYLNKGE